MVETLWNAYHFDEETGNTYEQSLDEDLGVYMALADEADKEAASRFRLILELQPKWELGTHDMWPLLPVFPAIEPVQDWMKAQDEGFERFTGLSLDEHGL